jgi:hypothetical protein
VPKRLLMIGAAMCATAGAAAQQPDVFIRVDARLHLNSARGQDTQLRWFDNLGRHSTVALSLSLEPGFRGFISQKIQQIPNDGDGEQLDEYYIEDPGSWRVGKQYLPFGRQTILRESARAARGDTNLILESLPITGAIFDNGRGRPQGVMARLGGSVGVSVAYGQHLGIQSTSLALVRRPEDAPGEGRGYRQALGADFGRRFGRYTISGEFVAFRGGHTDLDRDMEVSDLALLIQPSRQQSLTFGWSRNWLTGENFLRAQGRIGLTESVWLEPIVRLRNGSFYDTGVSIRLIL